MNSNMTYLEDLNKGNEVVKALFGIRDEVVRKRTMRAKGANSELEVTFKGMGSDNGAVKLLVNCGKMDRFVAFLANEGSDAVTHLEAKKRWNDALCKLNSHGIHIDQLPFPVGSGGRNPVIYHWSRYVGPSLISLLPHCYANASELTAKLALTLGAKPSTIEKVLQVSLKTTGGYRTIDSVIFPDIDPKRTLQSYLSDCEIRLNRTRDRLKSSIAAYGKEKNKRRMDDIKIKILSGYLPVTEIQQKEVDDLKEDLQNVRLEKDEGVMVHNDLINLYNITYDGATEKNIHYEGQVWFVGTWLPSGRRIEDMIGSKRMYPYLLLAHLKELKDVGKAPRINPYTKQVECRQLLLDLEKIVREDYKLGTKPIDHFIERVVDLYFRTKELRVVTSLSSHY